MTASNTSTGAVDELAKELDRCRYRGIELIDLDTPKQPPLEVPCLEGLAEKYAKTTRTKLRSRVAKIKKLLREALPLFSETGHEAEAELIKDLLFGDFPDIVHKKASELLEDARRRNDTDRERFSKLYTSAFAIFAGFLVDFVKTSVKNWRRRQTTIAAGILAVTAIVGLVVLSFGRDGNTNTDDDGRQTQAPLPGAPSAELIFDAIGGTPPIIRVFPGVTDSPQDKVHNGTFNHDEAMPAICKTKGRRIFSDPATGDQPRNSDDWIRIVGSPGLTQYATAVYVKDPEALLAKLPNC